MSEQRDASFRQVVKDAVVEVIQATGMPINERSDAHLLSIAILRRLHERGLAIHDPVNCRRVPWQDRVKPSASNGSQEPPGREMTLEEQAAVGLLEVADDVP